MNYLLEGMPDHLEIDGLVYPIKTDFREWIRLENVFTNGTDEEKFMIIFSIMNGKLPENLNLCIDKLIDFFICDEKVPSGNGKVTKKKVYNYEVDQSLIFTAFMQYYRIDLSTDKLHWWSFKNMLFQLPDESMFKKVMMYRSIQLSSNMTKEQRNFYAQMKQAYALPDNRSKEVKVRSVAAILAGGMNIN